MNSINRKIALLENKISLLELEKKETIKELKRCKKECTHDYLIGGIVSKDEEMYYCLSCGTVVYGCNKDSKVIIDIKDYLTKEEYASMEFAVMFNGYYDLAKNKLNEMLINDIPEELFDGVLITELVNYLKEYRNKDRGR